MLKLQLGLRGICRHNRGREHMALIGNDRKNTENKRKLHTLLWP